MMLGRRQGEEVQLNSTRIMPVSIASFENKGAFDRSDYNKALELNPNYADAYFNRGVAYGEKGDYDRAIADYTKVAELKPDFVEVYQSRCFIWRT